MANKLSVAFIGTGPLRPIAGHILTPAIPSRSTTAPGSAAAALIERGAVWADTPAEARLTPMSPPWRLSSEVEELLPLPGIVTGDSGELQRSHAPVATRYARQDSPEDSSSVKTTRPGRNGPDDRADSAGGFGLGVTVTG